MLYLANVTHEHFTANGNWALKSSSGLQPQSTSLFCVSLYICIVKIKAFYYILWIIQGITFWFLHCLNNLEILDVVLSFSNTQEEELSSHFPCEKSSCYPPLEKESKWITLNKTGSLILSANIKMFNSWCTIVPMCTFSYNRNNPVSVLQYQAYLE